MDPETMSRYDRACKLLHWSESGLVRQAIAAYFKVHLDYYVECSYRDLEAREMAVEDWYTTLRDKSIEELPRYKRGRPAFGATPLDTISPVDTGFKNKRRYGTISLGGFNFVLLRVAQLVDLGPQTQLISRIVKYHFDQYWETNYLPQIEFDEQTTLPRRNHAGLDNRRR
jgi:hypothetical protein